jgi:hypothetical protein
MSIPETGGTGNTSCTWSRGGVTVGHVVVIVAGLFVGAVAGFIIALFAGLIPFTC